MSVTKPMPGAARIAALRARRAALGLAEVRGIWARPEHHEQIKRYAERIARRKEK